MPANDMYNLRSTLHQHEITFCYSGYMTESVLLAIGNAIKSQMQLGSADEVFRHPANDYIASFLGLNDIVW